MSSLDDYYDDMFAIKYAMQEKVYNDIIEGFKNLSLEEKVDKLIKIYARERAYK